LVNVTEQVVERGTGKNARLDGYTVAGKTGTAAQLINGHYSKSEFNASFVGFVPSRHPRLAVLVVMDAPKKLGYHGAQAAAPIFKRVAEAALRHLGVPPTINPEPTVLVAREDPSASFPSSPVATRTSAVLKPAIDIAARDGLMPDVRGMSARRRSRPAWRSSAARRARWCCGGS
jgi:stage V sporulation protein D (sporulation-specific penicillin-binding protein)